MNVEQSVDKERVGTRITLTDSETGVSVSILVVGKPTDKVSEDAQSYIDKHDLEEELRSRVDDFKSGSAGSF